MMPAVDFDIITFYIPYIHARSYHYFLYFLYPSRSYHWPEGKYQCCFKKITFYFVFNAPVWIIFAEADHKVLILGTWATCSVQNKVYIIITIIAISILDIINYAHNQNALMTNIYHA